MTLAVSLDIEGDNSSAARAISDTSDGLDALTDKVNSAAAAAAKSNGAADASNAAHSKAAKAANDNSAAVAQLATQIFNLTAKATGASAGVAGMGDKLNDVGAKFLMLGAATGPIAVVSALLGIASAAAAAFMSLIPEKANQAEAALKEQERLVELLKVAYSGAKDEAAKFFDQSKAVTQLQLQQNLVALQQLQIAQSKAALDKINQESLGPTVALSGLGDYEAAFAPRDIDSKFKPFQTAIASFNATVAVGAPDVKGFLDTVAGIGNAAQASNPKIAAAAAELIKLFQDALTSTNGIEKVQSALNKLNGIGNRKDDQRLGIADQQEEYDRILKLTARQADQQRIEADSYDLSTAAQARYRAQEELVAAAKRAHVELDAAAIQKQQQLADAIGNATARLEGMKVFDQVRSPLENYNKDMQKLNDLLNAGAIGWGVYQHAALQASAKAFTATQEQLQSELSMRQAVGQQAVELLQAIGNKSQAAALAAIALNKALQIAQAIQNTAAASTRALAELGPIAGPPAAATITAWGAAQVALIAATGLVQGAQQLSGSAPAVGDAGASTASASASDTSSIASGGGATDAAPAQAITITVDTQGGTLFTKDQILDLFDQFNDAIADGAKLNVRVA